MKNLTELVFLLDKSGSMKGLEADTIGGYNSLLEKQKKEKDVVIVSTILFDTKMKTIHDRKKIEEVEKLTKEDYVPSGCTALLDAVGETITKISSLHQELKEEYVPSKTLFIITTDGLENSSHKYWYQKVKNLIERQKQCGWEFIFLGANISSEEEASKLGIDKKNAVNFCNDEKGIALNYEALDNAIMMFKAKGSIDKNWRMAIDNDFKKRKKQ